MDAAVGSVQHGAPSLLLSLPEDTLTEVAAWCDLRALDLLRKVCRRFRPIVRNAIKRRDWRVRGSNQEELEQAAWASGELRHYQLSGHEPLSTCHSIAVEGAGSCASASDDGTVRIWDLGSGVCDRPVCDQVLSLQGLTSTLQAPRWPRCLALHEGRLAIGCADGVVRVYEPGALTRGGGEVAAPAAELRLAAHRTEVTSTCFANHGSYLLAGGSDRQLYIWDVAQSDSTPLDPISCSRPALSLASDGGDVCVASGSSGVQVYVRPWEKYAVGEHPEERKCLPGLCISDFPASLLAVAHGRLAAASSRPPDSHSKNWVQVWDLATGQRTFSMDTVMPYADIDVAGPNTLVTAGGRVGREVSVWDMRIGSRGGRASLGAVPLQSIPHPCAKVVSVATSRGQLVSGDVAGCLHVWRLPHACV